MAETKSAAKKPAAKKTTAATAAKAPAKKATTAKKSAAKAPAKVTKVEEVAVEAPKAEVKTEAPKKAPAKKVEKQLKITLVKSGAGRLEKQKRTLEALGLRKTHSSTVKPDNACTRGMIFVVKHLVKVEEI